MAIKLTFTAVPFEEHSNGLLVGYLSHSSWYKGEYSFYFENTQSHFEIIGNSVFLKKESHYDTELNRVISYVKDGKPSYKGASSFSTFISDNPRIVIKFVDEKGRDDWTYADLEPQNVNEIINLQPLNWSANYLGEEVGKIANNLDIKSENIKQNKPYFEIVNNNQK